MALEILRTHQFLGFNVFNGYLYASTVNFTTGTELWRSLDGTTWTQVNSDGFGRINNNRASLEIIFKGSLYAHTWNTTTGTEIYRSSNGTNWTRANIDGFGDPNNQRILGTKIFNGYLYASTLNNNTGGEMWRSSDGAIWTQVNSDGFGDINNDDIRKLITFKCYLYATTTNSASGTEVWRTMDGTTWTQANVDGFGRGSNLQIGGTRNFGDRLVMTTTNNSTGAEAWSTFDGVTWSLKNQGGFGDANNRATSQFTIFGDYLYTVAYFNEGGTPKKGLEVWKKTDLSPWTLASTIGFGDVNNSSAGLTVFGNFLYAITNDINNVAGTEVWRTPLPAFTPGYTGNIEWQSPNFGQAPEGEGVKVADVDGDGKDEIVMIGGTGDGSVHVFDHNGTTYLNVWNTTQPLANALNDLVIGDTDGDGRLEIIVSTLETGNIYFYVFGFNGSSFQQEFKSSLFQGIGYNGLSLYAVDADGDGSLEIVVTSDEGSKGYIWVYDHDGTTYQQTWASPLLDDSAVIENLIMADIDGDSSLGNSFSRFQDTHNRP